MSEQSSPIDLDDAVVRLCAKTALETCVSYKSDNTQEMIIVSRNQALMAYHAIMLLIDPKRDLSKSIEEARKLRSDE